MTLALGIFDSFDHGLAPAEQVLAERLAFAVEAERLGVDHYHVTEHHGTPLSVCPSPNLFLAALSQRTTTLRMGALVYVLPAYDLMRLCEEISVLDQLTGGRLDLGVGSGVNPYEVAYFGVDPEELKPRFHEALPVLLATLESGRIRHAGTLLPDYDATLSITPRQRPHPPIWYASSNTRSATWAGERAINFVGRWGGGAFADAAREYWSAWGSATPDAAAQLAAGTEPRIGVSATVVIADSEQAARERYEQAHAVYGQRLTHLWHEHGDHRVDAMADPSSGLGSGSALVGTPASVREQAVAQIEQAPLNYFEIQTLFGDLTYDEGRAILSTFTQTILPAMRDAAGSVLA